MLNMSLLKNHWTKAKSDAKRIWLDEAKLAVSGTKLLNVLIS